MKMRFLLSLVLLCYLLAVATPILASNPNDYTVQPGDTLYSISRRYGVNVTTLAAANHLTLNSWLYVGQRLIIPGVDAAPALVPTTPVTGNAYMVQPGDTLLTIAVRHGVNANQLAAANGLAWNSWVYVGQRLIIPGTATTTPAPGTSVAPGGSSYTVQAGDNLFRIALRHGISTAALKAANGLSSDLVYVGQRLIIPGAGSGTPNTPITPSPVSGLPTAGDKWIDVNLSTQTITAYEGPTPVYSALVSTGLWGTPTVVGTYQIYVKYPSTLMSGPGYYLPNVPHVMYFYLGYAIHGAYWHNNFGTPMSHGCVNLSLPDAEWFYNWAPVGTKVVTHY